MGTLGGKREGAGRPRGQKSLVKMEREIAYKLLQERIYDNTPKLLNAQISIAKGLQYLYRIDEVQEGNKKVKKHVLVTSPTEIAKALDELEGAETGGTSGYYYVTVKEPSNMAIDSMFNRAYGRPVENVELTGKDGKALKPTVFFIPKPRNDLDNNE